MANVITGNPYILDTVTDTAVSPSGAFHEVYCVRWVSGSLADTILLQDAAGNTKWSASGTTASNVDQTKFDPPIEFNGIKIPTLDTGKVYIYGKRTR